MAATYTDEKVQIYHLGDFALRSGETIPDAFIAYKTWGNPANPTIICPTWYSGHIVDNEWLIRSSEADEPLGKDDAHRRALCALDPARYYIVVPALFGSGQSSSPSNTPKLKGSEFPRVTFYDNVRAQHELVVEGLGITHVRCVLGWSMGAGQAYQWATQYPDFMDLAVPFCGSAKTSLHNQVFLEGVKSALLAAKGAASGGICAGEITPKAEYRGWTEAEAKAGLKALGRVYAGWGFSQAFYREKLFMTEESLGPANDLDEFMVDFWEGWALKKDPENMLVMLHTWQAGDCSDQDPYNKDFELAMKSIKAKTLVLPGKTDLYFPPEDSEYEVQCMSEGVGKCIAFPSIWGHWAGGPGQSKKDVRWLDNKLVAFLEDGSW